MAKPIGRTGLFRSKVKEDGTVQGTYERIEFPTSKPEIEKLIADWFVGSMAKAAISFGEQPMFSEATPNSENDFDFTVSTAKGAVYLELQEAAPLNGPYENAPDKYKPYEYAQYILSKIRDKSAKYPKNKVQDIFLLIYVTHWSFVFSNTTIDCLRVWLQQEPTVFRAIFTFMPHSWGEGEPKWLYPVPPELRDGFDPEIVRDNICINIDAAKFQVVQHTNPNPLKRDA